MIDSLTGVRIDSKPVYNIATIGYIFLSVSCAFMCVWCVVLWCAKAGSPSPPSSPSPPPSLHHHHTHMQCTQADVCSLIHVRQPSSGPRQYIYIYIYVYTQQTVLFQRYARYLCRRWFAVPVCASEPDHWCVAGCFWLMLLRSFYSFFFHLLLFLHCFAFRLV